MKLCLVITESIDLSGLKRLNSEVAQIEVVESIVCCCSVCDKKTEESILHWLECVQSTRRNIKISAYSLDFCQSLNLEKTRLFNFLNALAFDLLLFWGNSWGRYLGLSVAEDLCDSSGFDVREIRANQDSIDVLKPVYNGQVEGWFEHLKLPSCLVISPVGRQYAYAHVQSTGLRMEKVCENEHDRAADCNVQRLKKNEHIGLKEAWLVFIGGRGLQSRENYDQMVRLAQKYHAAWGCTRAVALAGWDSYERVVGISGELLSADVCVMFGVSGASPFLTGIKNTQIQVAVNTDKKAPIFAHVTYGICADCRKIIGQLLQDSF